MIDGAADGIEMREGQLLELACRCVHADERASGA